jgi:hypothetical protein
MEELSKFSMLNRKYSLYTISNRISSSLEFKEQSQFGIMKEYGALSLIFGFNRIKIDSNSCKIFSNILQIS